ncbi:PaaI family thioesterase [Bradyrhizobium sp. UFLA05-112]
MAAFEPKNPDFRAAAGRLFDGQPAMRTLGISLVHVAPGEAELAMDYAAGFTQQNGFVHAGIITAGLDNACGVAVFTLMPREADILTVEFKTSLVAPARGEGFIFRAEVVKPGRTLTFCEAKAFARQHGVTMLVATMTATLMALARREAAPAQVRAGSPV